MSVQKQCPHDANDRHVLFCGRCSQEAHTAALAAKDAEIERLKGLLVAVEEYAEKCAQWKGGNSGIGPLFDAGMTFAYEDCAASIKAALAPHANSGGE